MTRHHSRTEPPTERAVSPVREFLQTETAGGVLLAVGAIAALVWANSPWSSSYERLWTSSASLTVGTHSLHLVLRQWVNEGLITIFFFVAGLEIKRELVKGQLATRGAALLPVLAALGGMLAPALIYLAIAGGSAPRGWAIVVATDIPLALGVLAIAGSRVPPALRVFLLALAIVDDIGALLIIAAVYSTAIGWGWVMAAVAVVGVAVIARRIGVRSYWVYIALGCLLWLALHEAGLNATLAGVAMGLLAPISVVEWLEHVLHPWASYVIVPIFALANTGLTFSTDLVHSAIRSPITWAIIVGRVIGKPLGIIVATKLVVGARVADAPADTTGRQRLGVATSAGMGFTVALFVTGLAFSDAGQRSNATLGILVAAVIAAGASLSILGFRRGDS
ncbi:MAG TPA: Na+/H+ antiporter NhaA [Ilumatobacteraceae bacterium]